MSDSNSSYSPFISIVMPAFNESKYINTCLMSVLGMDYPRGSYEIIVIDNGSTDDTVEIAKKVADSVYVLPDVRVGAVRNYGVSKAKGEYIAFLDSDCIPPKTWLKDALDYMGKHNCDVAGGTPLLRENPSWVESAWVINPRPIDQVGGSLMGGSILLKKAVFLDVGGFDEQLSAGEDAALGRALIMLGYSVHIAKCCAFVHLGYPTNIVDFTRRQIWHASNYLKSRKKGKLDVIFLMSLSFLLILFSLPILILIEPNGIFSVLAILLFLPFLLSLKRVVRSRLFTIRLDRYIKIYLLDFFYLLGRSIGLLKSIMVELKLLDDKKSYY